MGSVFEDVSRVFAIYVDVKYLDLNELIARNVHISEVGGGGIHRVDDISLHGKVKAGALEMPLEKKMKMVQDIRMFFIVMRCHVDPFCQTYNFGGMRFITQNKLQASIVKIILGCDHVERMDEEKFLNMQSIDRCLFHKPIPSAFCGQQVCLAIACGSEVLLDREIVLHGARRKFAAMIGERYRGPRSSFLDIQENGKKTKTTCRVEALIEDVYLSDETTSGFGHDAVTEAMNLLDSTDDEEIGARGNPASTVLSSCSKKDKFMHQIELIRNPEYEDLTSVESAVEIPDQILEPMEEGKERFDEEKQDDGIEEIQ